MSRVKFGYGQFGLKRNGRLRNFLTHRLAYIITFGDIPDGLCVLHRCDNPPCCNPSHYFLGTREDNLVDMRQKGRGSYRTHRGIDHGNAKLTDDMVREMRALYAEKKLSQNGLAARYGLKQSTVWAILHRKTWAHVA